MAIAESSMPYTEEQLNELMRLAFYDQPARGDKLKDDIRKERAYRLCRDLVNLSAVAKDLGMDVIAEDMMDSARRIKESLPATMFNRPEDMWRWQR
jgi:hypothetical protein